MADSVALLRRKVEDASLAVQDGTMDSVITLAAIEVSEGEFPRLLALITSSLIKSRLFKLSLARATPRSAKCMSAV